eukprot:361162-Chlamydomonas_euryale.AAC.2
MHKHMRKDKHMRMDMHKHMHMRKDKRMRKDKHMHKHMHTPKHEHMHMRKYMHMPKHMHGRCPWQMFGPHLGGRPLPCAVSFLSPRSLPPSPRRTYVPLHPYARTPNPKSLNFPKH